MTALAVPKKLTGVVRVGVGSYLSVVCPDASKHLQIFCLQQWQLRTAACGDRVELEYRETPYGWQWVVTRVLG